eukprot:8637553-Ditylum_brightwellii.AAC.1
MHLWGLIVAEDIAADGNYLLLLEVFACAWAVMVASLFDWVLKVECRAYFNNVSLLGMVSGIAPLWEEGD